MILDFLKKLNRLIKPLNLSVLCTLFLLIIPVYATTPPQKIICQDTNNCELYAITNQGQKLIVTGTSKVVNRYYSGWMDNNNIFSSFEIDCGTSCAYSYIVNYKTGQVSDQIYLIYAVNVDKQVIALPDPDDQNLRTLLVRPFFCEKGVKIKRNFDPDDANAISNIYFDKKGNLYLDYSSTPNQTEVKETVPIDYSQIQKDCKNN